MPPPCELLNARRWETRRQPALAVFEWIKAWYDLERSSIGDLSPIDTKPLHSRRHSG